MNENFDKKHSENERLNNLKNDLIVHFHQDAAFYERRTYIMFFIISGFGLYACLDLYKNLEESIWPGLYYLKVYLILQKLFFLVY